MTTQRSRTGASSPLIATACGAALVLVAAAAFRQRTASLDQVDANLAGYLTDHLTGSDAALAVVTRLSASHAHTTDRALFDRLQREFTAERRVVRSVLDQLGTSAVSVKRVLGQAAGVMLQMAAGREAGTLSYFRTLESLLVGVQGKRCLWRALQALERVPGDPTQFAALEQQALDQWRDIEEARRRQVPLVFGTSA